MRQHIHTTDIYEHANALPGWQQRYDQLSSGKLTGMLSLIEVGEVQVFRERLNQSAVQYMRLPEEALNILLPLTWPHVDEQYDVSDKYPSLLPDQPEFRIISPAGMDVICISIPHRLLRPLVDEAVQARWHVLGGLQAINKVTAQRAQAARALLALLENTPDSFGSPAIIAQREEEIVLLAVDWLETLSQEPHVLPNQSTRRYIVDRCHEWLLNDPDSSCSVIDLCKRLKVSRRTLQYSFQSIAGVTPVQYLRSVRLNGARRAMKQSPDANIADIAARWGFAHSSYFSLEYQKLFGELPSAVRRGFAV